MISYYLTLESQERALSALLTRTAAEAVEVDGLLVWPAESHYHRLPTDLKTEVCRRVARNREVLGEHAA